MKQNSIVKTALVACLPIFAFGIFCVALPVAVKTTNASALFLRVLELMLSWPVVVLVVCFAFGITFREAIREFLLHVGTVKLPGGIEFQKQPPPKERPEAVPAEPTFLSPNAREVVEAMSQVFLRLDKDLSLTTQQKAKLEEEKAQLQQLLTRSELDAMWLEYKYLDLFLAPHTKAALQWVYISPGCSRQAFHEAFSKFVPSQEERDNVLSALVATGLVMDQGYSLQPTEKAGFYLLTRGLIQRTRTGGARL